MVVGALRPLALFIRLIDVHLLNMGGDVAQRLHAVGDIAVLLLREAAAPALAVLARLEPARAQDIRGADLDKRVGRGGMRADPLGERDVEHVYR